jgi:hypothetical protein
MNREKRQAIFARLAAAIPEPTSWLAMGSLLGIGAIAYRRRQSTKQSS